MAGTITVECSDGEIVEINKELASKMSAAIRKKLDNLEPDTTIVLENITGRALLKVVEYCVVHSSNRSDLKQWDERFVKLDPGTLCELASAAYHLEIKPLVDLTCQAIAQLLKGKSPSEIRRTFNILYDFNPDDDGNHGAKILSLSNTLASKLGAAVANSSVNSTTTVPAAAPAPVQPTLRDKLRNKLTNSKRKEKIKGPSQEGHVDSRSVDDLVAFIENTPASNKSNNIQTNGNKNKNKKKRLEIIIRKNL